MMKRPQGTRFRCSPFAMLGLLVFTTLVLFVVSDSRDRTLRLDPRVAQQRVQGVRSRVRPSDPWPGPCPLVLPKKAYEFSEEVVSNYLLSAEEMDYYKTNPDKLSATELNEKLFKRGFDYVDIDNTISTPSGDIPKQLKVVEFNLARGRYWCEAAQLIRDSLLLNDTDIWCLNEFDLGMGRSQNLHTVRLFAHALGLNYAWGIEFLELTPGNAEEQAEAKFRGLTDLAGLTGNAILSRWPIKHTKIHRSLDLIDEAWYSGVKNKYNAGGFERRLGRRMVLIADIETENEKITIGSIHSQAWGEHVPGYSSGWEAQLATEWKRHHPKIIVAGDTWWHVCNNTGLKLVHQVAPGDFFCANPKEFTVIMSGAVMPRWRFDGDKEDVGISDHSINYMMVKST